MAFSPFSTFQKNRRFWMAMILMVCMVSFVFCTGMKGDMGDKLLAMIGRRGTTVARVGGSNVTREDLYALKDQRNVANEMMLRSAEIVFKKVSKEFFESSGKQPEGKESQGRAATLTKLRAIQQTLALRKGRPRYFESGTKFDDLLEFKLWQAEADRLGIRLEDEHVRFLFNKEFFDLLSFDEEYLASNEVRRNHQMASPTYVRRAIAEEFRVKMAQLAVMEAQPYSFFARSQKQGEAFPMKLTEPSVPDEIRAPVTLAQLWDLYKNKREEFDVTLIPVPVQEFAKKMDAPTALDEKAFFSANKNKPYDPSSPDWGLEIPTQIKVEYLMADPTSGAYFDQAKIREYLEVRSPLALNPMQGLVVNALSYMSAAQAEKKLLQRQYETETSHSFYRLAAPFFASDIETPLLAWAAKRHPQAAASLIASPILTPLDPFGAVAGYLAWGTKDEADVQAALRSEYERRLPIYQGLMKISETAAVANSPLVMVGALLSMDQWQRSDDGRGWTPLNPLLPVEMVQHELREMKARRQAEEWARVSMKIVKEELDTAKGDAEKFKRVLKKYVPLLNLTHGPKKDERNTYVNRYSIGKSEAFEPLKEAYLKYVDRINYYEGRDTTPETLLKPEDFYKMFFDSTEKFAATSLYQAMPWPPAVYPNNIRVWKQDPDPRFIKGGLQKEDVDLFQQHMRRQNDPNRQVEPFKFFETAEKPILFWRTAEISPQRPSDYDKLAKDLNKTGENLQKLQAELEQAKKGQNAEKVRTLTRKESDLKQQQSDLKEIQKRVTEGWKFERARVTKALPKAADIAKTLINLGRNPDVIGAEAQSLNQSLIVLEKVSQMHPEHLPDFTTDYFPYPLPKDKFVYPRPDMETQIVSLFDLKRPIEIKDADLDKINKTLFDMVKNDKNNAKHPEGKFVQILTNKPRSIFYVAVVTSVHRVEPRAFAASIAAAPYQRRFLRDLFLTRGQQQEAKTWRSEIVRDLGRALGYADISDEARKAFDERVAGD